MILINNQAVTNLKKGYIATITILIVMAVVMAITVTVALLSIGAAQGSLAMTGGEQAWNMTEGCMEDALRLSRDNISYSNGTLVRPEGTCTVTIQKNAGVWTVNVAPVGGDYQRSIVVVFNRVVTGLVITSWKEF